ncbi:MAG: tRNA preQ1(34) S-adenosylmethionine ribosyltransferase-isomerase QueA [Gammaproteobacteria bacterium]
MRRGDFSYDLPEELIAQYPAEPRDAARLLCVGRESGAVTDRRFRDFPELLRPGDLLVFNDTRVIPARLFGRKATGGRVEVLIERVMDDQHALAQIRASKTPRPGATLMVDGGGELSVEGREGEFFALRVSGSESAWALLERAGHVPLPPYIRREDEPLDRERYQTVFARRPGAVAAPTAGLHFTRAMMESLAAKHIDMGFVTLHVGAGTFQPLRTERVSDHKMHRERFQVSRELCDQVREARRRKGRIVAVGTTSVRCLETAARGSELEPMQGETDIFIYPGFEFRLVDALFTNFHLPESSLLMLICAFAGREPVLRAYAHAVAQHYRFYSYGDAMFIA